MQDWLNVLIITGAIIVILVISLIYSVSDRVDRNDYRDHIKEAVVGDYKLSAHTEDFHYWLKCDGRSLDRHEYCRLFDVIGTTFGSVDAHSFNLPDARGRVPGFAGQGTGLSLRTTGQQTGTETYALTVANLATHNHDVNETAHSHSFTTFNDDFDNAGEGDEKGFTRDASNSTNNVRTWNTTNARTNISIENKGNSTPFSIMQPTLFVGHLFIFGGVPHHHHPHPTPTPTPTIG
jgi:microcystin-dependent protein